MSLQWDLLSDSSDDESEQNLHVSSMFSVDDISVSSNSSDLKPEPAHYERITTNPYVHHFHSIDATKPKNHGQMMLHQFAGWVQKQILPKAHMISTNEPMPADNDMMHHH